MDIQIVAKAGVTIAVALPVVGGIVGGSSESRLQARNVLSWVAAVMAVITAVAVAVAGPAVVGVGGTANRPAVGLIADPLTVCVLVLVCGVGALVQSFASRYLQADPQAGRFGVAAGGAVSAMALVGASATVAGLVVGWVLAGVAFVAAAGYRRDLPGVPALVLVTRRALFWGDLALLGALLILTVRAGNVPLGSPAVLHQATTQLGEWHVLVGVLVALAALSRCAQGMFRRWLSLTVSAPTPACALLHAGVVNGGGILLVRFGPLSASLPAMVFLVVVAGATALWAMSVMAYQADVKGQLASSTMSQMGFMLIECGVGAYPAALIHLIGHGLYKAALFFASGSNVPRPGSTSLPERVLAPSRVAAGVLVALVASAAAAPGVATGDGAILVVYVAVSAAVLAGSWWVRRPVKGAFRLAWSAALVVAAGAYGALVSGLSHFIAPATSGELGGTLHPLWLLAFAVAALAVSFARHSARLSPRMRIRLIDAGVAPAGWDRPVAGTASLPSVPAVRRTAATKEGVA